HSIAPMTGTVSSHNLESLSLESSFSILFKWAFKEGEVRRCPHLVNIGREIVNKKKYETIQYWGNMKGNEIWNLPDT
ncbi:hypothetical protein RYX36_014921, partial [Vicia faba]